MQWGPQAWNILHGIGARAGKSLQQSIHIQRDESREVLWLMNHLDYIIPCAECRKHIQAYRKEKFPKESKDIAYWLWEFHEAVNHRLGKPSYAFTENLGRSYNLKEEWKKYKLIVKKDLLIGNLNSELFAMWERHFHLWLSFI